MWDRWNVDCGSEMIELDVDCLLFFPVEGTGSNPEWGDYSVVACCCVCMHMVVFGDTFGEVMLGLSPHNKQY